MSVDDFRIPFKIKFFGPEKISHNFFLTIFVHIEQIMQNNLKVFCWRFNVKAKY